MTTDELVNYYANLLILQYLEQPRAYATIQTSVRPIIMDQLPVAVQDAFDLDTAEGVQLDVLGKYVGASRSGNTFSGPVTLDDANFRILIKMSIFTNNSGSSLADIQNLIQIFFPGQMLVFDYTTMRISYFISIGTQDLVEMIIEQGKLPKPMGVQLGATIYAPVINAFFGFRTYILSTLNNSPFNTYASYQMDRPWLQYADALAI